MKNGNVRGRNWLMCLYMLYGCSHSLKSSRVCSGSWWEKIAWPAAASKSMDRQSLRMQLTDSLLLRTPRASCMWEHYNITQQLAVTTTTTTTILLLLAKFHADHCVQTYKPLLAARVKLVFSVTSQTFRQLKINSYIRSHYNTNWKTCPACACWVALADYWLHVRRLTLDFPDAQGSWQVLQCREHPLHQFVWEGNNLFDQATWEKQSVNQLQCLQRRFRTITCPYIELAYRA